MKISRFHKSQTYSLPLLLHIRHCRWTHREYVRRRTQSNGKL